MTTDKVTYLKFKQFLLDFVVDSINRRLIIYEKFDAIHQKIDQKVNVFKAYLKEIEKEVPLFDEYHRAMSFLIKLTSVLKNKLLIMRDMFNIKEAILFKTIMQEITLNRTRDDGGSSNNQHKNNKFFDSQFNQNQ